jgi:hypothetical protein
MQQVRNNLKWVDGKAVKNEFDVQILDLLGPKTETDMTPVPKQLKETKMKKSKIIKEGMLHIPSHVSVSIKTYEIFNISEIF